MELKEIKIKNFRSIKEGSIKLPDLDDKCTMFFGINGSGKSNILKSLNVFSKSGTVNLNNSDMIKLNGHESEIELEMIFEVKSSLLKGNLKLYIPEDIREKSLENALYLIHRKTFKKNSGPSTKLYLRSTHTGKTYANKDVNYSNYIKELPEVIFWKYDPNYLKTEINLNNFSKNLSSYPIMMDILKYMNIKTESMSKYVNELIENPLKLSNFKEEATEIISNKINELWESNNISFKFDSAKFTDKQNTTTREHTSLYLNIKEENLDEFLSLNDKSDGFKHFISFILSISLQNSSESLKNSIILLDEPELHLHPSSIEEFRDELLKISKDNYVFLSSHSMHMVDTKNLERHCLVEKKNGFTEITPVDPDHPKKEEIIFNALRTSKYKILDPYLVIFEGPTDQKLYEKFSECLFDKEKCKANIRAINAGGAGDVPKFVKFFGNLLINGFAVLDSDDAGMISYTKIKDDLEPTSKAFHLKELFNHPKNEITVEDLFTDNEILEFARNKYQNITFDESDGTKNIIEHINVQFHKAGEHTFKDDHESEFKAFVCKSIIKNIEGKSKDEVKKMYPMYSEFVINLNNELKKL